MAEDLSNTVTDSDTALVERIRMGERAAFDLLVRRHQAIVYRVCYRILGEQKDAADATQEALLRAYRKLDTFRGQSAFKTWLMRLTVNVSLNERERRKATLPLDEDHLATMPDQAADPSHAESALQIHQALQQVPPNHRAAVVLRDLEGFSYAEVAIALGVPEGTAKGWAHRGRSRLKNLLT